MIVQKRKVFPVTGVKNIVAALSRVEEYTTVDVCMRIAKVVVEVAEKDVEPVVEVIEDEGEEERIEMCPDIL